MDASHEQVRSPSPASSQASGSRGVEPGARSNGSGMSATAASEILSLLLSPRADTACTRLQALLGQLAACAHELRQQQRMVMPDMGMGPMGQAYEILLRPSLAPAVQQQLNMAAWEAGRCVESLASILFFIPAPGNSVEDMGVHTQAGRERVHGGGRRGVGGDGRASSPTLSEVMREDVAMDVSDLVVQVSD